MRFLGVLLLLLSFSSCGQDQPKVDVHQSRPNPNKTNLDTIVFGGGCFWCIEAVFEQVKGILSAESGYAGGKQVKPTYEDVCSGTSGHIEVVQLVFDSSVVQLLDLYKVFFTVHDPTSRDRQGHDEGIQYRSIIYYRSENQAEMALNTIAELNTAQVYDQPIVTEVKPLKQFYSAELYHQNYYDNNSNQPYCKLVIQPKLEKFIAVFENLKKD